MADDTLEDKPLDSSNLESVGLALEEIRRRFDDEERRRSSLDSKFTVLIALNALLVSYLASLGNGSPQSLLFAQTGLALSGLLSVGGLIFGHLVMDKYSRPLKQAGQIYYPAQKSHTDFRAFFLDLYTECTVQNRGINDGKRNLLYLNFGITTLSVLLALNANIRMI